MRETNLVYPEGEHPVYGTWLSVDVVAFTEDEPQSSVVLITREGTPHRGDTTLPGGLLAAWDGETVSDAANRILREKVGIEPLGRPVVVDVVSDPGRDERGHTVSIVVAVRVPRGAPGAVAVDDVPPDMPFGHSRMLAQARTRIDERLLTDPDTTYALLGDRTEASQVRALLRACSPITDAAARARLDRSPLYARTTLRKPVRNGRPPVIYVRTGGVFV